MYIYNTCSIINNMKKFEVFNNFNEPVLIIDENKNVIYKNKVFETHFNDFNCLQKFSHKINFYVDVCAISDDMSAYSPISQALISKEPYTAIVNYRSIQMKYYNIYAFKRTKYSILIFKDITSDIAIEKYKDENSRLTNKLKEVYNDYQNLLKTNQDNQNQALKMILINKISNIIRESINISKILTSAIGELSSMLNAFKAYYASYEADTETFKIKEVYPKRYEELIQTFVSYDSNTYKKILNKETVSSHCIKEFNEAKPFAAPVVRIILPIYHLDKLLGIIVLLSRQKRDLSEEINVLESISAQIGNAIIQASLFHQINEQKNELQNALKELKETQLQLIHSEKMASLGQLVAGVAHEINTPIGSIKSNNGIMTKLIKQIQDSDLAEMLSETTRIDKLAIDRISNLVVSLKKFVRLDEEDLQEADINKELNLTLDLIYHMTKHKAEIVKNYAELPMIKCYPNMLNQVFMNLLVNACQAIPEKGIITITTEIENNNLIVKIKDNGKGIKKENINKIFDAGFTTKSVGVGTGLGLAISSKIIQKHNGKISVTSEENIGTEFIVTIPVEHA